MESLLEIQYNDDEGLIAKQRDSSTKFRAVHLIPVPSAFSAVHELVLIKSEKNDSVQLTNISLHSQNAHILR